MNQSAEVFFLPHGPEARFLTSIASHSPTEVTATASLLEFRRCFDIAGTVDLSEWGLELLAQATPALLGPGAGGGVIVKVNSLAIHRPLCCGPDLLYLKLERLSPPGSSLAHFRGWISFEEDIQCAVVEADFKLLLQPPLPDIAAVTDEPLVV